MTHSDFDTIVHLNQNALEGVGPLDNESLSLLVKMSDQALVVEDDGDIAGFVITLPPGAEYDSSRYRWFEDKLVGMNRAARDEELARDLWAASEAAIGARFDV